MDKNEINRGLAPIIPVNTKINHGAFNFMFFTRCMKALGKMTVKVN